MCLFRIFRSSDDQPIINVNPHKKSSWGSDKDKGSLGLVSSWFADSFRS
jgi:hypothetical protein